MQSSIRIIRYESGMFASLNLDNQRRTEGTVFLWLNDDGRGPIALRRLYDFDSENLGDILLNEFS